jgi:hypothetical protein
VNRDAERYRNEWIQHAKDYSFVLIAPEFSEREFPGDSGYNFGGTVDQEGHSLPRPQWAFSLIEPIFDDVRRATGNRTERFYLYGHSAGAQFVHRYLYFVPGAHVAKVVAANAGWWTLPDLAVDFPYGLRGSVVDVAAMKSMLQRPLAVLLGSADNDPNHRRLRRTPEAMAQGLHRFARGHHFFNYGRRQAAALGVPFGWTLAVAPGIGHHDSGMSAFAVEWLFGHPSAGGRDPDRVRVLFGGDTGFGESYLDDYARKGGSNVLAEKGYEYCLAKLDGLLRSVDYRVINLETPLTTRHDSPLKTKDYDLGQPGLDDTFAAAHPPGMAGSVP